MLKIVCAASNLLCSSAQTVYFVRVSCGNRVVVFGAVSQHNCPGSFAAGRGRAVLCLKLHLAQPAGKALSVWSEKGQDIVWALDSEE
jgi:hypothetical protein